MKTLTYIFPYLFLFLLIISCSPEVKNVEPIEEDEGHHLHLTEEQFVKSNFKLGTVTKAVFNDVLKVSGTTHLPEKNKAAVSSFIGGTVSKMNLIHGQWVNRGQVVFSVKNPELITWQQDLLVLRHELEFQESEFRRQQELITENIGAKKAFEESQSILRVKQSQLAGLSKKLEMIGIDPAQVSAENLKDQISITAPNSGYLTEIDVKEGMYLEPFKTAMEIANTNHIHMELMVFEKDLPRLKKGQTVSYSLQQDPDERYKASIYLIEKNVGENRMVTVHCHLEEEQEKALVPGMFVSAEIHLDSSSKPALPEDAVVSWEGEQYVLKLKEGTSYEFEPITIAEGRSQNGFFELEDEIGADTISQYLVSGAYYLMQGEAGGHSH